MKCLFIAQSEIWKIKILFTYSKIFQFCDFMSNFCEMVKTSAIFGCPKKFKLIKYERIIYDLKARDPEILNM